MQKRNLVASNLNSKGAARRGVVAIAVLAAAIQLGLGAGPAKASSEGWFHAPMTPIQIAFTPGGQQIFDKTTPVYGLRLSLLYGTQKKIYGLDLGLFSDAYKMSGIQLGLGNQVFEEMNGLQLGVANSNDSGHGLQIGILNRTHGMKGLQLGVLNWNDQGFLPVFPFFNFTMPGEH